MSKVKIDTNAFTCPMPMTHVDDSLLEKEMR